jgi:hypothetical protein
LKGKVVHCSSHIFENKANAHEDAQFHHALPGCAFTDFQGRAFKLEQGDGDDFEVDSFGYMLIDRLEPGVTCNESGICVVEGFEPRLPVFPAENRQLKNSPDAKKKNIEDLAKKYMVGEIYSGESVKTLMKKVYQLEGILVSLKKRLENKKGVKLATDQITCLIGAATLVIKKPAHSTRKNRAEDCMWLIATYVTEARTPLFLQNGSVSPPFSLCLV